MVARQRVLCWMLVCPLLAVTLTGCAGLRLGANIHEFEGELTNVSYGEGREHLETQMAYDPTLGEYVEDWGRPDYIYVLDRYVINLLYTKKDEMVIFERPWYSSESHEPAVDKIPIEFVREMNPIKRAEVLSAKGIRRIGQGPDCKAEKAVSGTGFPISPGGLIMTAYHVVKGRDDIKIHLNEGRTVPAKLKSLSSRLDVAILTVDADTEHHWVVPETSNVQSGMEVFTIGFPAPEVLGNEPKFSDGVISSLSGIKGDKALMQVSVPIAPGSSGGPLFTKHGRLVGVVLSSVKAEEFFESSGALPQNINWGVKASALEAMAPVGDAERFPSEKKAKEFARKAVCMVVAK